MSSPYNLHNPLCREVSQSSPEGLGRNIAFTLLSIQERTYLLPRMMEDFNVNQWNSKYFQKINKWKGAQYIETHLVEMYEEAMGIISSNVDVELRLILLFSQIPMISVVKAGFITQMLIGKVGCLDSHNLKKYDIDPKRFHITPKLGIETKTRKINDYVHTCNEVGGCRSLWNKWCNHVGKLYKKQFPNGGFEVSKLHSDCLAMP